MLEDAVNLQARQGIERFQLPDHGLPVALGGKTDASHAGVDFQVYFHLDAGGNRSFREGPGILGRKTGGGNIILSQDRCFARVGIAKNQNRYGDAVTAQPFGFGQAADGKGRRPFFLQDSGHYDIPVAISIRLDNGTYRTVDGTLDKRKIVTQGIQVNFCPAVFSRIGSFIGPTPSSGRYAAVASRQCRFPAGHAVFSGEMPGLCG